MQPQIEQPSRQWPVARWLHFLENRHAQEMQLGLARIHEVADQLGLLESKAKVITVTGTNGKGSTVASLQAIYLAAGYTVGTYTSPHLLTFNERIKINGLAISDEALVDAFYLIEAGRGATHLTYFETATLAALWYFNQQILDIIILEVGIGGRLDATNIISADLSIITTVDFDHQDYLGDSLEKIGFEKAGILREAKPFIYADNCPPASILQQASALNCHKYIKSQDYDYQEKANQLIFNAEHLAITIPKPAVHEQAFAAAIMATQALHRVLPVPVLAIQQAAQTVALAGRLQCLAIEDYHVLFDVSHNAQSATRLAYYLANHYRDTVVHAVFSALADKDIAAIIAPLKHRVSHWYPALLTGKRAANAEQLQQALASHAIEINFCHNSPSAAFHAASSRVKTGELIVVYGSFHTVGAILPLVMADLERRSIDETNNG